MKKLLAIFLISALVLTFVACDNGNNQVEVTPTPTVEAEEQTNVDQATPTPTVSGEATPDATATAEPTATPEPTCQHAWGDWTMQTKAYVSKAGTDKRVCSLCQGTETKERTENAVYNSFYDFGYQYVVGRGNTINSMGLIGYAASEFGQYAYKPTPVSTVVAELKKYFNIDSALEADLIQGIKTFNYDAEKDEIVLEASAESGDFDLRGYKHLSGNKYSTYYTFTGFDIFEDLNLLYEIVVEFNRDNGKPNKFVSFTKIQELPSDMIEAKPGERVER